MLFIPRKFTIGVKIDITKVTSENIRGNFQFSSLTLQKFTESFNI